MHWRQLYFLYILLLNPNISVSWGVLSLFCEWGNWTSVSCSKLWLVDGWASKQTHVSLFPKPTEASGQNGFFHVTSVLQVSKLSPREGQLTCPRSHHKEVMLSLLKTTLFPWMNGPLLTWGWSPGVSGELEDRRAQWVSGHILKGGRGGSHNPIFLFLVT